MVLQYVDLRTQYSELTTLTSQYLKFITETLRRLEKEEVSGSPKWLGVTCLSASPSSSPSLVPPMLEHHSISCWLAALPH